MFDAIGQPITPTATPNDLGNYGQRVANKAGANLSAAIGELVFAVGEYVGSKKADDIAKGIRNIASGIVLAIEERKKAAETNRAEA